AFPTVDYSVSVCWTVGRRGGHLQYLCAPSHGRRTIYRPQDATPIGALGYPVPEVAQNRYDRVALIKSIEWRLWEEIYRLEKNVRKEEIVRPISVPQKEMDQAMEVEGPCAIVYKISASPERGCSLQSFGDTVYTFPSTMKVRVTTKTCEDEYDDSEI